MLMRTTRMMRRTADKGFAVGMKKSESSVRWIGAVSLWVGFVAMGWGFQEAEARRKRSSELYLNDSLVQVYWNDGDSFRVKAGSRRGQLKARLMGFNTLENHGPVHRWGKWTGRGLQRIAWNATNAARRGVWHCRTVGKRDAYQRVLVDCPDLAKVLVSRGLAHVYSVRGPGDSQLLKLQQQAQQRGAGMWAKGVPSYILTSLHSAQERRSSVYNRLISTKTGASVKDRHSRLYRTCEWVCSKGSCMLYVPFKQRYGRRRAACLRRNATEEKSSDLD